MLSANCLWDGLVLWQLAKVYGSLFYLPLSPSARAAFIIYAAPLISTAGYPDLPRCYAQEKCFRQQSSRRIFFENSPLCDGSRNGYLLQQLFENMFLRLAAQSLLLLQYQAVRKNRGS